jgi:hypothetical protein
MIKGDMTRSSNECDQQRYLSIVGSLMYAALGTRPDIAFCVSWLSRHNKASCAAHMTAAIPEDPHLIRCTDSDWAGNTSDRKSMGAYVFCISGGAISWQSKKQEVTAVSTQEAEYIAFLEAGREAIWLRTLLHYDIALNYQPQSLKAWIADLLQSPTQQSHETENALPPTRLFTDNQGHL